VGENGAVLVTIDCWVGGGGGGSARSLWLVVVAVSSAITQT
jgi:hypothetical protein